jgi:hypothetical protein
LRTERDEICAHVDDAVETAVRERESGHTGNALEVLQDLARRCPAPRVTAQLALAEMDAHRWADAWQHIEEALTHESDPWILSRRAGLLVARAEIRPHLCTLALRVNAPGAVLRIGEREVGRFPLTDPVLVGPGALTIDVVAPGYRPFRRSWTLSDGQRLDEELPLVPLNRSVPVVVRPVAAPIASTSPLRYAGFAVAGAGAVALVVGAIFFVQSASQSSELESATATSQGAYGAFVRYVSAPAYTANDRSVDTACGVAESDFLSTDARLVADLCASNQSARTLAWVFGLGGLALGGAGLALILANPSTSSRPAATAFRVSPSLGHGHAGLVLRGAF